MTAEWQGLPTRTAVAPFATDTTAEDEANRLAAAASLYGWHADVTVHRGDRVSVEVKHPAGNVRVTVRLEAQRSGRHRGLNREAVIAKKGFLRLKRHVTFSAALDVILKPPVVTVQTDVGVRRQSLSLPDTGCVCCGRISPPEAFLTLTPTGLCHSCATWHIQRIPTAVPDEQCAHVSGPWHADGLYFPEHRWRTDPRATLGYAIHEWLRARGANVEMPANSYGEGTFSVRHRGERVVMVKLDQGLTEVTYPGVAVKTAGGRKARSVFEHTAIAQPARHELLDILNAFDPRQTEAVRHAAVTRLAMNDDYATRLLARCSPAWEEIDEAIQVESFLMGESSTPRRR